MKDESKQHISLYTVILDILEERDDIARAIPTFRRDLAKEKEKLRRTHRLEIYIEDLPDHATEEQQKMMLKDNFIKNVILLEEFIKEIVAILQVHCLQLYHQVKYINFHLYEDTEDSHIDDSADYMGGGT